MSENVISAVWSDWQNIKTRGVIKLIFECPAEQTEHVLQILGAPRSDESRWVAIAPLIDGATQRKTATIQGGDRALRQSHMLCRESKFQHWIVKHIYYGVRTTHGEYPEVNEESARAAVLDFCLIASRAELTKNRTALERWEQIVLDFRKETGVKEEQ